MGAKLRPRRVTRSRWNAVLAGGCVLAGVAGLLVAVQQPGYPQVPPQPVDQSVWVVNDSERLVGRINTGIGELDSATALRGSSDVLQDPTPVAAAPPVLVVDQNKHELQVLDTATVTFGSRVAIPENADVQLRSGTLAVTDRADGRLWVGNGATVSSVDARSVQPQATLGALPAIAVSTAGTVFATAAGTGALLRVRPGSDPVSSPLPDGPLSLGAARDAPSRTPGTGAGSAGAGSAGAGPAGGATTAGATAGGIQVTAVGDTPVVLDRGDSSLRVDGRRIMLPDASQAVLQQPGPAAAEVVLGTGSGILAVTLADGTVRTVADLPGDPVAPVIANDCVYGAAAAESGDGWRSIAVCSSDTAAEPARPVELAGSTAAAAPAFRQHGPAVVLADNSTGLSWVATDGYRTVNNWADVNPPDAAGKAAAPAEDPTPSAELRRPPPDCTAVTIGKPVAADDDFGVRAGRATVLQVLDNDASVDCTAVVIDSVSALPAAAGSVAIVAGGSAIQVTVPATATGKLPPIEYVVGNGRGDTATAKVAVTVVPAEESQPPEEVRRSAVSTESGATVSYNVLDDFVSPTGDDLFLVSATTDSSDAVSFRPDGTITDRNTGTGDGTDTQVLFTVSDGVQQTAGTLAVSIKPKGSTTPVVYPSFVSAVVGAVAVVNPLANVLSASADPVTISTVQAEPGSSGATARLNARDGSIAITAATPGSYYFTFEAASGGHAVTGVLRADFRAAGATARSVVPMADVAYLTPGGQTVLDPLTNDTDPDGQGLAVQQVDLPADAPITAAVVDLHLVQLSAPRTQRGTVIVGYSVFDGSTTQQGQIRVVPVPAQKRIPPPLAAPITATVRAGDVVTIPVARFTTSQDSTPVTAELDQDQLAQLPGRAVSTGDTIRYLAPADAAPGVVSFGYTAVAGSSTPLQPVRTASTVTITVTAADPARNSAPSTPAPVIARVFAGSAISISVPLAGIDPDGDWVVVDSIEQPEKPLGRIAVSGPNMLSYNAFTDPGVDRIRYRASDPGGRSVIGEVTVLVVGPAASARPPVAPDIAVAVRPGASIRIDPLTVVADPGGQRVKLGSPAFTATPGLHVEVDDQSLIVTAPPEPTVASLRYAVVNAKGLAASGSVKVTVTTEAPTPAPTANDLFVQPADLATNNRTVDVDLTGSITNHSGRRDQLTVSVDPLSAAEATTTGPRTVRITVAPVRQVIAYRVTDGAGAAATAFIVVPPRQQLVGPQLIAGAGPIQLNAGQSVDVRIADYVTVGGGRPPSIAATPEPQATQGTAVRDSPTTLTLSAPPTAGGEAAVYVPIAADTADTAGTAGGAVTLAIPVQITPRLVPPPKLDSTDLDVEAGTSGSVDLAALTTTYDALQAASVSYQAAAGSDGVQAVRDGSVVTVTVRPDVPRGTRVKVPIQVVDGDGRNGKATLTVSVTGSRKPLATVVDQAIDQGRAGRQVSADLLTGSSDPIGLGLTVGRITVTEGATGIATGPTLTGSTVRLTPAAGFVGAIVLTADVGDGTKDPNRVVTATLRVDIQDRPSAPGTPALVDGTLTADSAQLTWDPADANGAAVQGYTVQGDTAGGTVGGGSIRQDCPDSSCTVTGLTVGRSYTFVVTARNAVGTSDASDPSAPIVPDAAPTVPPAPVAKYLGRGQLTVSWVTPTGAFTAVTGTSLRILRGADVLETREDAVSPTVLDGLEPSGSYRFEVSASNALGASDFSAPSAAIVPSGVPSAPADVQATFRYDAQRRGIDVAWTPPADTGGEPVRGYRLLVNNSQVAAGDAAFRSQFVPVTGDDPVSVAVIARNSRGEGPAAAGPPVQPFSRPSQVTGLALTPGDQTVVAAWDPATSSGRPLDHYDYRVADGAWTTAGTATTAALSGLTKGKAISVEVRACNGETGYTDDVRCGEPSKAATATPFGALAEPEVTAELTAPLAQTVKAAWTIPDGNGRPVTQRSVTVTGDAQLVLDPAPGHWTSDPLGYGKQITITVRYCVSGPDACAERYVEVTTPVAFDLPTIALEPLTGTCGATDQYAGKWLDQQDCGAGSWVVAPEPVTVLCQDPAGLSYPEVPDGNPLPTPTDRKDWVLGTDRRWYRAAAVDPGSATIPTCD